MHGWGAGGKDFLSVLVFVDDGHLLFPFHDQPGYGRIEQADALQISYILAPYFFRGDFIKLGTGLVAPDGIAPRIVDENSILDAVQDRENVGCFNVFDKVIHIY